MEDPAGLPLWQEMIGLTMEVGKIRQEFERAISALRQEVVALKVAQKPLASMETLHGTTKVLQEELSSCQRALATQQNEIEQMKRLKNEAKHARIKKDDAALHADAQVRKLEVQINGLARKDDLDKVRNAAKAIMRKNDATAEELTSVRKDIQELLGIKSELSQLKKLNADRATMAHVHKIRRNIMEEVSAKISEMHSEGLTDKICSGETNDANKLVTCKEVVHIKDDLASFRQAHQKSLDQSLQTFSKVDDVLQDMSRKSLESFTQIDLVTASVHHLREDVWQNEQDLRERIAQIDHIVETQLEHIGTLLADIEYRLPRRRHANDD